MHSFLESLAERILQSDLSLEKQAVILPTKRSASFLTKILAGRSKGAIWLPEMFTFNEWASKITGLEPAENLFTSFSLYEAYLETMRNDAQSISDFLSWSNTLLSDFNDIDANLIDPKSIFRELVDYTEIDQFSFLNSPLSEKQESYRLFWKTLPLIYKSFRKKLLDQNIGTSGIIMRRAAETAEAYFEKNPVPFVTVAGFNALTNAENNLLKALERSGAGKVYFDADDYLMRENLNSGTFIRRNLNSSQGEILKPPVPFNERPTQVTAIAATNRLDQANGIAAILEKTSEEDLKKTGLVLADESMLLPVIERLPETIKSVNVTMGLSLGNSSFRSWVNAWIELHLSAKKDTLEYRLTTKAIQRLLNHPFSAFIGRNHGKTFQASTIRADEYEDQKGESILLQPINSAFAISNENLRAALDWTLKQINSADHANSEVRMGLLGCTKLLETIERLNRFDRAKDLDLHALHQIFGRVLASTKLSLIGEPMEGLQLMGVLETRALGFDNLILCSADEGNFPKNDFSESFIPFEIRLFHGLPGRREKEAVFAYEFYRLLSHSKNFSAVYHTDAGTFSGGEMSRYLLQIQEDFEIRNKKSFSHNNLTGNKLSHQIHVKSIAKTEDVISVIRNRITTGGLSASSINRYYESTLEWYYGNILSLPQPKSNEIDPSTFGTVVHHCLEHLFKPFEGKVLVKENLSALSHRTEDQLKESFRINSKSQDFDQGINKLHFETALKMIRTYLHHESDGISKGDRVEYLDSERREVKFLDIEAGGAVIQVKIKGTIDRTEVRNGVLHLIDFKTGQVSASDLDLRPPKGQNLTYEFLEKKLTEKGKALQLLLYDWLLSEGNRNREVRNQIVSLAAPGKRDLYLNYADRAETLNLFEEFLRTTVGAMLDPANSIEASEKFEFAVFE